MHIHRELLPKWTQLTPPQGLIIVGSADTLENARIGTRAEDYLPNGGTSVWKEFIQHLRAEGQVLKVSGHEHEHNM